MLRRLLAATQTLRVRIIAIVALCWLLPTLVLGVYMSSIFFNALRTKTEQALVAGASHAEALTVREIERILQRSKQVTYDEEIYTLYTRLENGEMRYEDFYIQCRNYWHRMFQRDRAFPFTALFSPFNPDLFVHTATDANSIRTFARDIQPYILTVGETLDTRSRYVYLEGQLFHVRNLYNRRLERFGMMVLNVDHERLLNALLDPGMLWNGHVDILLDEFEWIAHPDYPFTLFDYQKGLYSEHGELYYANQVKTSDYMLTYRIRLDQDAIYGQANQYYQLLAILLVLLIPVECLILLFMHRSLTRPLLQLANAAQRLAGGELGITVPTHGRDEISQVATAFNAMSLQMRRMIDKSYREEIALRDARISALQSRINPHFMNNALELMNWQARMEGAESVSQMIEAMSTLINAALDRTNERTVPLYTEVEVADAYLFFIKQRFGERVSVQKQLDPELSQAHVPRMIIQTLLENAVEHGISPAGGGVIRLHVYEKHGTLYIDVRNNGRTLSDADKEKVHLLLSDTSREAQSEHLGIRNINLRLKLIYQEKAGLSLSSEANGVTLARITIPYTKAHDPSRQAQTTNDTQSQ